MEYLDGETLAQRLARGKLPLDQALRYAIEIADALSAAHKGGVVHRDLKPSNVILTSSGAKLLDFGLARMGGTATQHTATHTARKPLTAAGMVLGTVQYMSPEQLAGRDADARSDCPTSKIEQMCGCESAAIARASRSKRCLESGSLVKCGRRTLIATMRFKRVSHALYTSPIPPAPTAARISYGPSRVPVEKAIVAAIIRLLPALGSASLHPPPLPPPPSRLNRGQPDRKPQ
jgi:serine/threonine protein kinase